MGLSAKRVSGIINEVYFAHGYFVSLARAIVSTWFSNKLASAINWIFVPKVAYCNHRWMSSNSNFTEELRRHGTLK